MQELMFFQKSLIDTDKNDNRFDLAAKIIFPLIDRLLK